MNIFLTEKQLSTLINEAYYIEESIINNIISYIKSFGEKGKLPSFEGKLSDCFKPSLQKAYEWACQSTDGVKRNGIDYFDWQFRVNVTNNLIFNKRGLIYVERSIDLDLSKGFDDLQFKSIGECWSWRRLNSRSYCSSNYNSVIKNDNMKSVILCGYVHPQSIDWVETIYLNSYRMKNETEIRMNDNAQVEVAYIKINNEKYRLKGSYLLNASADKYRKKNW
jgi:hypothetical protein